MMNIISLGLIDNTIEVSAETEKINRNLRRKYGELKNPIGASCAVFYDIAVENFSFDGNLFFSYGITGEHSAGNRWTFPGYMEFIPNEKSPLNILFDNIKYIKRNNKEISVEDFIREIFSKKFSLNPVEKFSGEFEKMIQKMISQKSARFDFTDTVYVKVVEDHRFDDAFDHAEFYK